MDLIDRLNDVGDRFSKMKDQVGTEEATKNAFIMPFISSLGYDVFNPMEVVPEYTADIGTKKGEKVDYCILQDENPVIIIECKHWKEKLDIHKSQLHRYFHVTPVRFAILTNGNSYKFYSDLEEPNKMDDKPFFEFSLDKLSDNIINELKKFQKSSFDVEGIVSTASDLKYSKEIKELLNHELKEPSEDFIRLFVSKVYSGRVTQKVFEQFEGLVKESIKHLINDLINERLTKALGTNDENINENSESSNEEVIETDEVVLSEEELDKQKRGIVTTEEELEGLRIVQAISRRIVSLDKIKERDTKSYFGILYEDNNRKPICRLHLNSNKKYISLFDKDRNEEKILIEKLEDIYLHETKILDIISIYSSEE